MESQLQFYSIWKFSHLMQHFGIYLKENFLTDPISQSWFHYVWKCNVAHRVKPHQKLLLNLKKLFLLERESKGNFCSKWSFSMMQQNSIKHKFQTFTCKPSLAFYVCSFMCMTWLASRRSSIVQNFVYWHNKTKVH